MIITIIVAVAAFAGGAFLGYKYGSRAVAAATTVAADVKTVADDVKKV